MRMNETEISRVLLLTIVVAMLGRLLMLGFYPLMDTTEARYAEIARKMVELNDWVTPWYEYGVPFWGKPPLSFWLTAASFKLFGINEFAARFPHWLGGVLVIWLVWGMVVRRSHREALYALAILTGSVLFLIASGAVMTDMTLAVGITLAMRSFWLALHGTMEERRRERWILFVGIGIGLLAKGPLALVLVMLPIAAWAIVTRNVAHVWSEIPWLRGGLVAILIASPWYVLAELHTPGFLNYFLVGEHFQRFVTPGWNGDLYGNAHEYARGTIWMFALAAFLPWSVLIPIAMLYWRRKQDVREINSDSRNWRLYVLFWGLAPAVFFTAASNILWTYLLPGAPGLALWAAGWLAQQQNRATVERLLFAGVMFTLLATLAFILSLPVTGRNELKSAKALVSDYQSCRSADEALVFIGKPPYSGAFYSQGKAQYTVQMASLALRIKQETVFIAIPKTAIKDIPPSILEQLTPVSQRGGFDLFVANRHTTATASCVE